MANTDAATGLKPVGGLNGAPFSGRVSRYYVPASDGTAIYVGGLVKPAGSADANGVMSVTGNVATGDSVMGVVVSVEPVTRASEVYRAASTARYVLVADDPNTLFEIQEDSVGAALAAANVGNSADLTGITGGATATGLSSMEIDSSTATASGDGTEDVLLLGLSQRVDNEFGDFAKWVVRLNNHFAIDGQAGA